MPSGGRRFAGYTLGTGEKLTKLISHWWLFAEIRLGYVAFSQASTPSYHNEKRRRAHTHYVWGMERIFASSSRDSATTVKFVANGLLKRTH